MKNCNSLRASILLVLILIISGVSFNLQAQSIAISFTVSDYHGNNISCHGASDGSIETTVSGGSAPYTFLWSTTDTIKDLSNLPAGMYMLTVMDSLNVTTTDSVLLTEPSALGISLTSPTYNGYNINVYGDDNGSINSTVTGGTTPYDSYVWSNGSNDANPVNLTSGIYTLTVTDDNGCSSSATDTLKEPAQLLVDSISIPQFNGGYNISCHGGSNGSINLWVNGGVPPYYANVNTMASLYFTSDSNSLAGHNIQAGGYQIWIHDASGAEFDTSITLTEPPHPVDAVITEYQYLSGMLSPPSMVFGYNVSCHYCADGVMTIAGTDSIEPYTFAWYNANDSLISTADSISGLKAGGYYAIATDANGCSITKDVTLYSPSYASLALTMNGTDANCHGDSTGSIDISITGGTPPYVSYLWSNGATTQNISSLPAGTYSVTVYDARNDSISDSIYVAEPTAIAITFSNVVYNGGYNESVSGGSEGSISTTITGGTASYQSYSWSSGSAPASVPAGIYTLTVTDANGCTGSASDTLTEPPALHVDSLYSPLLNGGYNTLCKASSDGSVHISMSGGVQPYNGQCFKMPSGLDAIVDSNSLVFNGASAGSYTIKIFDANGAELDTSITLTEPTDAVTGQITQLQYQLFYPQYNVSCTFCPDGAMSIAGSGGIPPYTYQWYRSDYMSFSGTLIGTTDSITNLGWTGYNYYYYSTVSDANGCSANVGFATISYPVYQQLQIEMTGTPATCHGDSTGNIDITVTGGTPPYTSYLWSNGATTQNLTSVSAGTYSVTVYDTHNDSISSSIDVSQPSTLNVALSNSGRGGGYSISMHGGSDGEIHSTVTGGTAPYEIYNWSTGSREDQVQGLQAGTYTLTVTDGAGCAASAIDTLIEPTSLHVDSISAATYNGGNNVSCNGSSDGTIYLAISGGVPGLATGLTQTYVYYYAWSNEQGGYWNSQVVQNAPAGHYSVEISDANGATLDTSITLTEPADLTLFLVPSVYAGNYNVSCTGCTDGVLKDSLTGGAAPYSQQWYDGSWNPIGTTNPLSNLSTGYYNVTVTDANGCQISGNTWLSESTRENWRLGGNSNTDASVNFIGTRDSVDLVMRTNNAEAFRAKANGDLKIAGQVGVDRLAGIGNRPVFADSTGVLKAFAISPPEVMLTGYDVICNGDSDGRIHATIMGGAPQYVFNWSNGATTRDIVNLAPGAYWVTVTDADSNTVHSDTVTINQPDPLTVSFDKSSFAGGYNISLFNDTDGSISPVVSGGTASYHYLWNTGATMANLYNLPAGPYNLAVFDSKGCIVSLADTLTETPFYHFTGITDSLKSNGFNVSCHGGNDGRIDFALAGGFPPYNVYLNVSGVNVRHIAITDTFTVSGHLDSLAAANYDLVISDGNDHSIDSALALTDPPALGFSFNLSVYPNTYNVSCYNCADGIAGVHLAGGDSGTYTLNWYNSANTLVGTGDSISGLAADDYHAIALAASGCQTTSSSLTVSAPKSHGDLAIVLQAQSFNGYNLHCHGDTTATVRTIVVGGQAPFTYLWSRGDTSKNLNNVSAGAYILRAIDAVNDTAVSDTIFISEPGALGLSFTTSSYGGGFNISVKGDSDGTVTPVVTGGVSAYTYNWNNGATTAAIDSLQAGTYSVSVTDMNQCVVADTVTLTEPTALHVDSISSELKNGGYNLTCNDGNDGVIHIYMSGGVPSSGYSYAWSNGQGGTWTTQTVSSAPAGHYTVQVTDANGAVLDTSINVTEPAPLQITLTTSHYPNGYNVSAIGDSDGTISAALTGGISSYTYQWTDVALSSVISTDNFIDTLKAGLYQLAVTDANGCTASTERWIVQPNLGTGGWQMAGNAHSDPAYDFIGTSDSTDLVFRTNNLEAMRVTAKGDLRLKKGILDTLRVHRIMSLPGESFLAIGDSSLHFGTGPGYYDPNTSTVTDATNMIFPSPIGNYKGMGIGSSSAVGKGLNSVAIGNYLAAQGDHSIVMGMGTPFFNTYNISNSLMIGFSSPKPSIFVGPGDGGSNIGKVGIGGTTTPIQALDVDGKINVSGGVIQRGGPAITNAMTSDLGLYSLDATYWLRFVTNNGSIRFFSDAGAHPEGGAALMQIEPNGNVGIGTDPLYKLDVKGAIHACKIKVDLSIGGCDYVFDSCYALTPLKELSEYLKNNKHLPDVAPAKEMEANGVDVAEMQTKLLKKIEELTLYTIELQKQIEDIKLQIKK